MKEERLHQLFEGWLHNQLSAREQAEWMELLVDPTLENVRQQIIENYYDQLPLQYSMEPEVAEALFRGILRARRLSALQPFGEGYLRR